MTGTGQRVEKMLESAARVSSRTGPCDTLKRNRTAQSHQWRNHGNDPALLHRWVADLLDNKIAVSSLQLTGA